ncbi:uncharacterized protein CTRU02_202935 [Colletotrichum truncatum]|uniref:Uncharacterized protein n=1 Tax=Colletotrichum truncatum TaxID=5467 RepID=A0ACC3Z7V2_COLTU|nr:uncharacterized protein CTRU02_13244 [Colletotrichum truncatum]KAF6783736.1 hypothetical protein CTRU02_13244 [Colletotrichum truncatum]
MPVVIKPQPNIVGRNRDAVKLSTPEVLSYFSFLETPPLKQIISASPLDTEFGIAPNKSGFVHTIIRAFQQDLHLRLRPDDVWLAILIQLGFYIIKHEADLRHVFVAHAGKLELTLDVQYIDGKSTTLETVDFGIVARMLAGMVTAKLKDAKITTMLLPSFTTTTTDDKAVAAVAFLGLMKEWFDYQVFFGCGFPSVTLLGAREDWASMLARISWIGSLNKDLADWALRLSKVIEYMVASFDRPDDDDIKQFWMRAVHVEGPKGSGVPTQLSGWLTAFCWWTIDGDRCPHWYGSEMKSYMRGYWGGFSKDNDDSDSDQEDSIPSWTSPPGVSSRHGKHRNTEVPNITLPPVDLPFSAMKLGKVVFPTIDRKNLPMAIAEIPVLLLSGEKMLGKESRVAKTKMSLRAGSIGMQIQDDSASTVQPISGWWLSVPVKS